MPFKIKKIGEKFHVVNADTGKDEGESDSLSMAKAHLRALYARSGEEARASYVPVWQGEQVFFVKGESKAEPKKPSFTDLKSQNLQAHYRQVTAIGGEPVFVKATWSDAARQAAAEARRSKATDPEHALSKMKENDLGRLGGEEKALASFVAYKATDKAIASGKREDHLAARKAHLNAHIKHFNADNKSAAAADHKEMMAGHESEAARINSEAVKAEPKKPFWQESHPNRDWRGGFHED